MEVKVQLHAITIKDEKTGEEFTVQTLCTAEAIAGYVEESDKDIIVDTLHQMVAEAFMALEENGKERG